MMFNAIGFRWVTLTCCWTQHFYKRNVKHGVLFSIQINSNTFIRISCLRLQLALEPFWHVFQTEGCSSDEFDMFRKVWKLFWSLGAVYRSDPWSWWTCWSEVHFSWNTPRPHHVCKRWATCWVMWPLSFVTSLPVCTVVKSGKELLWLLIY